MEYPAYPGGEDSACISGASANEYSAVQFSFRGRFCVCDDRCVYKLCAVASDALAEKDQQTPGGAPVCGDRAAVPVQDRIRADLSPSLSASMGKLRKQEAICGSRCRTWSCQYNFVAGMVSDRLILSH